MAGGAVVADTITFLCTFPPIQSAIKVTGNGDGLRIQLDIPESEMAQAAYLLTMRERILKVTIEVHHDPRKQQEKPAKSTY